MEKIEADIFNIIHNTKIRLQGDAEDNYGFMGKGYAEKLAIEIAKEIQPSEKKALSVERIDESVQCFKCGEYIDFPTKNLNEDDVDDLIYEIVKPDHKLAIKIRKAIHSALPASSVNAEVVSLDEEISHHENEIRIEQWAGNVVKEAQEHGIVMGLRIAQAKIALNSTKKAGGAS